MKFAAVFLPLLSAGPLHAELLATFQTTRGNVTVVLQYDKAPQAVANFITLAQGTRALVNPADGAIHYKRYYTGEKFFRVINESGFKIAQTGSGTGTNSGGPAFTFRDEFHAGLTHVPYVLSMANSGPNSNSSQIFFTGNSSIPSLNNVHTIFGLIPDSASRTTMDAILAGGNDATTITGVTISRTDPAATAFDEHAQNIPTVICPRVRLNVIPGVSNTCVFDTPLTAGDVFQAFGSTTLASGGWISIGSATRRIRLAPGPTMPSVAASPIDNALEAKAFYNLAVTRHPGSVAPDSLANRTITVPFGTGSFTYTFNTTGRAGTITYTTANGIPSGGPFITFNPFTGLQQAPSFDPNNVSVAIYTESIDPGLQWLRLGCDAATSQLISGHHNFQYYNDSYPDPAEHGWEPLAAGAFTISR
ncbi:peptidylprolyl isomerase [Luteolibacter yonseiensis]|uniref:peptidylprolyl isomerase n=1 Tax=Luteolibacter yonseiensis TaxID=1144680 RepID=A0A934V822_9BACT|nr:peptidylprolyl isomerase [Luteolibacter yonseiensis]MBK1816787.1 peptidylprolyl isomerase [Luteolibacter yonseiensis]